MRVLLAQPRGFCAGVIRAIEIVERALQFCGPPVYVFHEIVHNRHVVEELNRKGAIFVENLQEVPHGSVTIFSAHGVAKRVVRLAAERNLAIIDATCPLVTKVHSQALRYRSAGKEIIIVGHAGHAEVKGTQGQINGRTYVVSTVEEVLSLELDNPEHIAYVTQTTLSTSDTREVIDALEKRFPKITGPELDDICYATQNRQDAVRRMADIVDVLVVVGARNSSNSNRLREVGEQAGIVSHLIETADELSAAWFRGTRTVGITAGASAPELLVREVITKLKELGASTVSELPGEPESTVFPLPRAVQVGTVA
ncbi:MAG: 4-hydroxy-3-methylbut-2-enyl diphosphate reductase [Planctomycetota bacterium]